MTKRIAVIPGDGIGVDVTAEAVKVMETLSKSRALPLELVAFDWGTEEDVNFVVLRENTEGAYVGMGGNFKRDTLEEIAVQEDVNTRKGVERILAQRLGRSASRRPGISGFSEYQSGERLNV